MKPLTKNILIIILFLLTVIPIAAQQEKKQATPPPTQTFGAEAFAKSDQTVIRWLGNGGLFINSRGTNIMIDPLLKGFDMPLLIELPIRPEAVPHLDAVIITHNDNDHYSIPTNKILSSVTKEFHSVNYVASLMEKEGFTAFGHNIGDEFQVKNLKIRLTPANHAWPNAFPGATREFKQEDYCGFWIETPDGNIWATGDSRLMPEHFGMPQPDAIFFDFSDSPWYFGLEGAVKLANAYPNTPLLLSHWGTVDAPDMKEFNGDPEVLKKLVVNPERVYALAPGEPFILKRMRRTVDIHSHIIPAEYMDILKKHHAELDETFPLPAWDIESHLAFMDKAGIETSVLTLPAPQPYFGDVEESRAIIRKINEHTARIKADYPGRFKFCAVLPLPDVDAAIREAVYALDTLHADGIKLASNSLGQYLGDEALDPLMEVLNERKAVIIIHPHRPTPYPEKIIETTPLAMYEYPAETTRAVVNMLSRNLLVKYPDVKVVVPHVGSFLPMTVTRMKNVLPAMLAKGLMEPIDWEGNLSRLYYDLAGNPSPEIIKVLLTITTPDHIMYGSDYPYLGSEVLTNNLKAMKKAIADDKELAPYQEMIFGGNANSLFEQKQ